MMWRSEGGGVSSGHRWFLSLQQVEYIHLILYNLILHATCNLIGLFDFLKYQHSLYPLNKVAV